MVALLFFATAINYIDRASLGVLERIRGEFPGATHHCWAYVLGNPDGAPKMRFHDASEPAGGGRAKFGGAVDAV